MRFLTEKGQKIIEMDVFWEFLACFEPKFKNPKPIFFFLLKNVLLHPTVKRNSIDNQHFQK